MELTGDADGSAVDGEMESRRAEELAGIGGSVRVERKVRPGREVIAWGGRAVGLEDDWKGRGRWS